MLQPFLFAACPLRAIVPFDYPYLFARDKKKGEIKRCILIIVWTTVSTFQKKKKENLAVSYHMHFSSDF